MPRRHYDLDEVLAFAESGKSAPEIVEILGLSVTAAAISKQVRKYLGPRPRRPVAREDGLRRILQLATSSRASAQRLKVAVRAFQGYVFRLKSGRQV